MERKFARGLSALVLIVTMLFMSSCKTMDKNELSADEGALPAEATSDFLNCSRDLSQIEAEFSASRAKEYASLPSCAELDSTRMQQRNTEKIMPVKTRVYVSPKSTKEVPVFIIFHEYEAGFSTYKQRLETSCIVHTSHPEDHRDVDITEPVRANSKGEFYVAREFHEYNNKMKYSEREIAEAKRHSSKTPVPLKFNPQTCEVTGFPGPITFSGIRKYGALQYHCKDHRIYGDKTRPRADEKVCIWQQDF